MINGTIRDYLLSTGWVSKGKCSCDGKSDKYEKGRAVMKVRNTNSGDETPEGRFRLQGKGGNGRSIGDVIGYKEVLIETLQKYGL